MPRCQVAEFMWVTTKSLLQREFTSREQEKHDRSEESETVNETKGEGGEERDEMKEKGREELQL